LNIDTLQKNITQNTEALHKSIKEFNDGSTKDRKKHVVLLTNLKGELTKLSKAQDAVVQQLGERLESAGSQFNSATKDIAQEIEKVLSAHREATDAVAREVEKVLTAHEQATEHICIRLDEHKEYSSSLCETTEEMKTRIQEISACFMDFVAAQTLMYKKQGHFSKIMLIAAGTIVALLALSIIV
jgi:archaellum component FlaC